MGLYKAKTLKGATGRVRALQEQLDHLDKLAGRFMLQRQELAKLAAEGPAFDNPLKIYEAKKLRDLILEKECGLNPDGSFIKHCSV